MIDPLYLALPVGGAIIGFFTCAALTAGKVADASRNEWEWAVASREDRAALDRCADALTTVQGKIEDIRELLNRARTIRKKELAAILDGDAL